MGCRSLNGQHLAGSGSTRLAGGGGPLGSYEEQRSAVRTPEHAGEAAAVQFDGLQNLPAFADAPAALVGHVRIPDGAFGVEADAVGTPPPRSAQTRLFARLP